MSRHHVRIKHGAAAREIRAEWSARIASGGVPCLHCRLPVLPGQPWDLAHITPAAAGGRTTRDNTRPAHRGCNRADGGRAGARITNRRARELGARGTRSW